MLNTPESILAAAHEAARVRDVRDERTMRERIVDALTAVIPAIMEEAARGAEGNSPLFDHQTALAECRDCESGFHSGRVAAAAAIRAISSLDHSSDARNMVQDHIADAGKLVEADGWSVMPSVEERLRYWRERALNAETKALTLETVLMLAPADQRQWHLSRTLHEIGYFNRGDLCTSFSISVPQASKDIGRWMQENPGRARYNTSSKRYEKIDTGEMFDLFSWVKK